MCLLWRPSWPAYLFVPAFHGSHSLSLFSHSYLIESSGGLPILKSHAWSACSLSHTAPPFTTHTFHVKSKFSFTSVDGVVLAHEVLLDSTGHRVWKGFTKQISVCTSLLVLQTFTVPLTQEDHNRAFVSPHLKGKQSHRLKAVRTINNFL